MPKDYSEVLGENLGKALGTVIRAGFESVSPGSIDAVTSVSQDIEQAAQEVLQAIIQGKLSYQTTHENLNVIGNCGIVGCGIITGGSSYLKLGYVTDPKARACYQCSILCSAAAITTGGAAALSRACSLSAPAALSEVMGYGFLKLGDQAQEMAFQLEGKRRPRRPSYGFQNTKDVSFMSAPSHVSLPSGILTGIIHKIPFQRIGQVVGFSISIYFYGKLAINGYRSGKRRLTKFKKTRNTRKIHEAAKIIVILFAASRSYVSLPQAKVLTIYRLAVS